MKHFFLLLFFSFSFYQCSNSEKKQEQVRQTTTGLSENTTEQPNSEIKLVGIKRSHSKLKMLLERTAAFEKKFGNIHQHIPYAMFVNNQFYFVVATGNWKENNWSSDNKAPEPIGSYKVGLVSESNEVIIPTQYDKIYNMGGIAANLIEVELDGKLGAYDLNGKELLSTEFDAIYPYNNAKNAWVQIRKGSNFGWLSTSGQVSMEPNSHTNKGLFKAQPLAALLTNWSFDSKSDQLIPFFKTKVEAYETEVEGLLILPSYLYHLDLVPEFRTEWNAFAMNGPGNGETEANIKTARKAGNNQTIVSAFRQYFADPRGQYEERSDIITVNEKMEPIDKLSIEADYIESPCYDEIRFHFVNDNTLEVSMIQATNHPTYSSMTNYIYHNISAEGKISPMELQGLYPFTRMTKITNAYFKGCFSRGLTIEEEENLEESEQIIAYAKLDHLTIEDLDLMRNEIYAIHGYKFKGKKWQDYFGQQTWYKAQFDNVDDQLSEIEKHNITVILNQKKKMEGNEAAFIKKTYEAFNAAG